MSWEILEHKVTLESAFGTETQVKYIQTKGKRYNTTAQHTAVTYFWTNEATTEIKSVKIVARIMSVALFLM